MMLFSGKSPDQDTSKNKPKQQDMLYKLLNKTQNSLNIYEIQKQLMEIQIMLKILFSEQQYAAIKFCGNNLNEVLDPIIPKLIQKKSSQKAMKIHSEENIISNQYKRREQRHQFSKINEKPTKYIKHLSIEPLENNTHDTYEDIKTNHLDKLEKIDRDEQYFDKQFQKFLYHYQNDQFDNSEIDKRIYESMISFRNISNKSSVL